MMMDEERAKELGQELQSTLHVGKDGITEGIIEELDKQLDKNELVKVQVLRNNPVQDMEKIAEQLQEKSIGELVEVRGKTVLMHYQE